MPNAIICSMPAEGHVRPLLVVATALLERGWGVRFLTGARYEPLVHAAGVEFVALPAAADTLDAIGAGPRERGRDSINKGIDKAFLQPAPIAGQAVVDLLADQPADVVIHEPTFVGVQVLLGLPREQRPLTAMCGILPLGVSSRDTPPYGLGLHPWTRPRLNRLRNTILTAVATQVVLRPVHRAADRMLAQMGAPQLGGRFFMDLLRASDLLAQFTVPEFEFPRSDAPANLRFYGPMTRLMPSHAPVPDWFEALDHTRPVVHVTQGTVANTDFTELIGPTLRGLAHEDVTVVVTTGGRPVADLARTTGPIPSNAHVAEFLPYDRLLPRTDVLVTNGGYGGLHHAMEHGVPIVVAGDSEDKVETSCRVSYSGVGINLRTSTPTPAQVRGAVTQVLDRPAYAEASRRIGEAIAVSPGPEAFIDDLEHALRTPHAPTS